MDLRELLGKVGEIYLAQKQPNQMSTEVQRLLRDDAGPVVAQYLPGGYIAEGSGGKGTPAHVPWIAVFDPDETDTATRGMYLCFLFAADMKTVSLCLMNGVTELRKEKGGPAARAAMQNEAQALRSALENMVPPRASRAVDLKSAAERPRDYEWGTILAQTYRLPDLPDNQVLVSDLRHFVLLYALALDARNEGRKQGDPAIVTHAPVQKPSKPPKVPEFKPKNDADYLQIVNASVRIKTRKHETLVKDYGDFLAQHKFTVATNCHPQDLEATRGTDYWLIEAKIVYGNKYQSAAREAMGQLIFYRRFLTFPAGVNIRQLALFNESPGEAYTEFFDEQGMSAVWQDGDTWKGTATAKAHGLC